MMLAHLLVAGVVEGVLTMGVIAYLQRANLPILRINGGGASGDAAAAAARAGRWRWALIGLGTMVALTPLGLIAPGGAFGEDAPEDLDLKQYHLDAVPSGLRHYAGFWHNALFDGYAFSNDSHSVIGYLVSAVVGIVAIAGAVVAAISITRIMRRRRARPDEIPESLAA
jgi:cobalt/nickel transport system permease protein